MKMTLTLAAAALLLGACAAQPATRQVAAAVKPARPDLRSQTVRMALPPDARTVGDAAEYVLEGSGYSLVLFCKQCPKAAPRLASEPVSPLAFAMPNEITSATRALLLILGEGRRLLVDDQLRLVTFDRIGAGL